LPALTSFTFSLGDSILAKVTGTELVAYINALLAIPLADVPLMSTVATNNCILDLGTAISSVNDLIFDFDILFGVVKINGTSYNVANYLDPTTLYLDNESSIKQSRINRLNLVKTLTVLTNYAVTGLDYTALTALETLTMRNGSMTDTLRNNVADRVNSGTVKKLEISDWGATELGKSFMFSNLVTVAIGGVSTISTDHAFYQCASLTSVSLPALTSIAGYSFRDCSVLATVTFSDQIVTVDYTFRYRPDTLVNLCLVGQTNSAGDAVNGIVSSCYVLNASPYKMPTQKSFTFSIGERIFAKTIGDGNIATLSANASLLSYVTAVLSIRHADVPTLASTPNRIFNLDSLKARINTFLPADLNALGVSDSLFNQYQLAGNISSRS
jgi:hypothetical protein